MEANEERNRRLMEEIYRFLDTVPDIDDLRVADRVRAIRELLVANRVQLSGEIHNISALRSNCPNKCAYCYVRRIRALFHGVADVESLPFAIDEKRVQKGWRGPATKPAVARKMIMFPSSHDIVPGECPEAYMVAAEKILAAGHDLLIVTKPRETVIRALMTFVERTVGKERGGGSRVQFLLTITSMRDDVSAKWEPGAPLPGERLACLRALSEGGFWASVIIEPYLSDPREIVEAVMPLLGARGNVWIGHMRGPDAGNAAIRDLYTVKFQRDLLKWARIHPQAARFRWKTSFLKEVIFGKSPVRMRKKYGFAKPEKGADDVEDICDPAVDRETEGK